MLLIIAYPSLGLKGQGFQLTSALTLYIKVAISCNLIWCRVGRLAFCQRALKHSVLDLKTALKCTFLNSFKFQKCHTMSQYVR